MLKISTWLCCDPMNNTLHGSSLEKKNNFCAQLLVMTYPGLICHPNIHRKGVAGIFHLPILKFLNATAWF